MDRTGDEVDDGWGLRWTGGWISGGIFLANRKAVRTFKPGVDAVSQPAVYNGGEGQPGDATWESAGYAARVFRTFREYVFAGAPTWDTGFYPTRVQWSAAVEPGQVPDDWNAREDNDAGDVDLADSPGAVVDMVKLRDSLIIFKEDSIHLCQWVGRTGALDQSVFAFRGIVPNKGVYTTDCAVEYNGFLWVQGLDDIFAVDGNTANSIVWGRLKNSWLADKDPTRASYSFTALDTTNEEILFFYVSKGAPGGYIYPDKALVRSLQNNTWFFRDYGVEMSHARLALDVANQSSEQLVFYGIDRTNNRLLDLEAASDRLGTPVPAYFTRSALFSDPGHDWVQVDEAKLQISGQEASFRLGGQIALDAPITWEPAVTFDPATDYKIDTRHNNNMIAVRVDVATLSKWRIGNLNLLVQKSGER